MAKTFEDLVKANGLIKTTNVSGKDYAEVNQRVKAFRCVYPEGFILTELVSNDNGICVFRAQVGYYNEAGSPVIIATGTAYEKENSTFINKTSYIENCETSAVGRALGMAGYGIDKSIASAEEVQNAITNQKKDEGKKAEPKKAVETEPAKPAEPVEVELNLVYAGNDLKMKENLDYFTEVLSGDLGKMLVAFGLKDVNDLTLEQIDKAINLKKKAIEKRKAKKEVQA